MIYRDDGVYLNVLPVCECGEVIRDLTWNQVVDRHYCTGFLVDEKVYTEFDPVCCPFCGQTIKGLQVINDFFKMFKE